MRLPIVTAALLATIGCSMGELPTRVPGPGSGSAARATAPSTATAPTPDAPTLPTCLPDSILTSLTTQADALIACFASQSEAPVTTCWSIADDNTVHAVSPVPLPEPPSHARPVKDPESNEPIDLYAPDGWTIAPIRDDNSSIRQLEVCDPSKACKRIPLAPSEHPDVEDWLATVAIDVSGTWVVVDRGQSSMSDSRIELHAIATGKLIAVLAIPGEHCTNVVDVIGDKLLLQGSDCANMGVPYAVFTWQGKRTTPMIWAQGSLGSPYAVLAPNRWVFADSRELVVWDVQRGKKLAGIETERDNGEIVVRGGVIVDVLSSGVITRYDEKLAIRSSGRIPPCASE